MFLKLWCELICELHVVSLLISISPSSITVELTGTILELIFTWIGVGNLSFVLFKQLFDEIEFRELLWFKLLFWVSE